VSHQRTNPVEATTLKSTAFPRFAPISAAQVQRPQKDTKHVQLAAIRAHAASTRAG